MIVVRIRCGLVTRPSVAELVPFQDPGFLEQSDGSSADARS
jgi:hypothetical protein